MLGRQTAKHVADLYVRTGWLQRESAVKDCLTQIGHQITVSVAMDCELKHNCSPATGAVRLYGEGLVSASGSMAPV